MFGEPILILLRNFICTILLAGQVLAQDAQVIERWELADGLIREKLLLQSSKEAMEPWARDLSPRQLFVLIVDLHFHGERTAGKTCFCCCVFGGHLRLLVGCDKNPARALQKRQTT